MNRTTLTRAALLAALIVLVSGAPVGAQESAPASLALGSKAPMADTKMKTAAGSFCPSKTSAPLRLKGALAVAAYTPGMRVNPVRVGPRKPP